MQSENNDSNIKGDNEELVCPTCGLVYSEFKEYGRLGCYDCYEAFSTKLDTLIKKIHNKSSHKNKQPEYILAERKTSKDVEALLRQLKHAVMEEEYEEAADLIQKIALLEDNNKKLI